MFSVLATGNQKQIKTFFELIHQTRSGHVSANLSPLEQQRFCPIVLVNERVSGWVIVGGK